MSMTYKKYRFDRIKSFPEERCYSPSEVIASISRYH